MLAHIKIHFFLLFIAIAFVCTTQATPIPQTTNPLDGSDGTLTSTLGPSPAITQSLIKAAAGTPLEPLIPIIQGAIEILQDLIWLYNNLLWRINATTATITAGITGDAETRTAIDTTNRATSKGSFRTAIRAVAAAIKTAARVPREAERTAEGTDTRAERENQDDVTGAATDDTGGTRGHQSAIFV
ncbi:hypothetical protein D9756_006827 [Leucocoprinus leucothites]|uniref:Uncharacterized protein n=1 Tax=Leucocoprinus leucothites TaxID=201217 RepID=A0A8H5G1Y1_9AGAR|nr:hypothetical protein D9756_006827 [Leucoagaricus leucothites]